MTKLSKLMATTRAEAGGLTLAIPTDWMQGRSAFGGLQVAVAVRAMRALVPDAILRTLQTTFIAPIEGDLRVQARILRTGKNAVHVEARIGDGSSTQALVVGVFGAARSSVVHVPAPQPMKGDDAAAFELPLDAAGMPGFMRHFQVRWLVGRPPYSSDRSTRQVLEISIDDEGPATEAHLLAIADFIPPIGLSWLDTPAPGSTLTWMLELLIERIDHLPLSGWRVEAELVAAQHGYTSQAVTIFAASGEPVALSHQSMLVFG